MLKESILFVASAGLLVYFIAPSGEEPKPAVVQEEAQKPAPPLEAAADDGWDYEDAEYDDEPEDESFVFGEPTAGTDDDEDEADEAWDEESGSVDQTNSTRSATRTAPAPSRRRVSNSSPQPGEQGSAENPFVLETSNPADPTDD